MANVLTYTGQGTGAGDNDISESLKDATASFFMVPIGDIKTNVEFVIEWLPGDEPDNSTAWQTASGTNTTLNATNRAAAVNFAKGFKYRVRRTGTGNQNEDIKFYWGHVTTTNYFFG